MKAWQITGFGSTGDIHMKDIPEPRLERGFVRVRVARTSVNHIDRLTIGGRFGWVMLPRIPGSEYVGTVEEVATDVENIQPGDRVAVFPKMFCGRCRYCISGQESTCLSGWDPSRAPVDLSTNMIPLSMDGGWSEKAVAPAVNIVSIPDRLTFDNAFAVPLSGMTAWHMVRKAKVASGEKAVVMGSNGAVGISALQILKQQGASVLAVVSSLKFMNELKRLGADVVSLSSSEELNAGLNEFAGETGADIIIDPLGQSTFQQSFLALSPGGRYVTCGSLTGASAELNLLRLYSRQIELIGSTTGSKRDLIEALNAAAAGKLTMPVDSAFRFEDMQAAIQRHSVRGKFGKVRITVSQ